jgi:methyl-accepting chemotaxis protein
LVPNHADRHIPGRPVPIGIRVAAGVGGMLVIVLIVIALAVMAIVRLTGSEERFDGHYLPYATAIADAQLAAKGMANDERGFLLSGDPAFLKELDARSAEVQTAFQAATAASMTAEQRQLVMDAIGGFDRWSNGVDDEVRQFQAGDRTGARSWSLGQGREIRKQYELELAAAQAHSTRAIASNSAAFSSRASQSLVMLGVALVIALVAGVALAIWLVRTVLAPVHSLVALLGRYDELRLVNR